MDQPGHTWIAIRAIALLEETDSAPKLVELLKPHAREAAIGAWMPDLIDAKRGGAGSATNNHIFKMSPYGKPAQKDRFTMKKADLLKHIGEYRLTYGFLSEDSSLDATWWQQPYKAEVRKQGQHLPNRIMALSTMLKDLLLTGDKELDDLIPGKVSFVKDMDPGTRTPHMAAAMYFFMISHFIADVTMPCHCDGRELALYGSGLHKELEDHWADEVGKDFEKKKLLSGTANGDQLLSKAKAIDTKFGIKFDTTSGVPNMRRGHDAWLEAMYLCRASFAIASIMAPCQTCRYDDNVKRLPFEDVFGEGKGKFLKSIDKVVMHDAVLNTAIIWRNIWKKMAKL